MKKKNRKLKIKNIIKLLIFLWILINLYNYTIDYISNNRTYKTIKLDHIENYSGIGQEKVNDKDGYFTTFTTDKKYKKTYIEYKQNGDSTWSNKEYWGGSMSDNGCGITVMATILSGYNKKYTPDDLREKYYPVLNYENLSKELSSEFGIKNTDFYYDSVHLSKEKIVEHLQSNRPIIICVWNEPNKNRWTEKSHYMALLATDGNDFVYVSNPNGGKNDSKSSGWYNIKEIIPYLAKALYVESYE